MKKTRLFIAIRKMAMLTAMFLCLSPAAIAAAAEHEETAVIDVSGLEDGSISEVDTGDGWTYANDGQYHKFRVEKDVAVVGTYTDAPQFIQMEISNDAEVEWRAHYSSQSDIWGSLITVTGKAFRPLY